MAAVRTAHSWPLPSARVMPLAALCVLACGDSTPAPELSLPVEASSFRRVHSDTSLANMDSWRVRAVPSLRIGTLDGAECMRFESSNLSASEFRDGRIVVGDPLAAQIRVFSSEGECITSMGRRGLGPGEFASTFQIAAGDGDTVKALSAGIRSNLLVFTASRGLVQNRSWTADSLGRLAEFEGRADSPKLLGGGWLLLKSRPAHAAEIGNPVMRDTIQMVLTDGFGEKRVLGRWADENRWEFRFIVDGVPMSFATPVRYQSSTYVASDPYGRRVCVGDSYQPAVACYDAGGSGLVVSWKAEAPPVSGATLDTWISTTAARVARPSARGGPSFPRADLEAAL